METKLKVSENADPNYLATVVKIGEITNHPNADKLELTEIFGNTVVLGKGSYVKDDLCVYFPVESCLSPKFLSWANLYDKEILNADGKTKGFFSQKGNRVKAVKLRGIPSQGFLYKIEELAKYYNISPRIFALGESFDTVGEDLLVTKYIRPEAKSNNENNTSKNKIPKWINTTLGIFPRTVRTTIFPVVKWYYGLSKDDGIKSLIVDGQFRQHYKTENFYKNSWILQPDDDITITSKIHGTSFCAGYVLCKRNLGLSESVLSYFGLNIPKTEYKLVYSSRNILQNRRDGKYTDNLYGKHAELIEGKLPKGVEIFGEILGWASPNKTIQSQYDYGVIKGESELWVYRASKVDECGNYYEFTWEEIERLCEEIGLKTVPVYFKGKAKDLFPDIPLNDAWGDNWMKKTKEKYLDKICEYCTTGVVNEGVVIKINSRETKPVFKYKSPNFLVRESEERDRDELNLEDEN
jgi:tRNA-binding EMAP/Myf-like protein